RRPGRRGLGRAGCRRAADHGGRLRPRAARGGPVVLDGRHPGRVADHLRPRGFPAGQLVLATPPAAPYASPGGAVEPHASAQRSGRMSVTVVVPSRGTGPLLRDSVENLVRCAARTGSDAEVLVVVNGRDRAP